MSMDTRFFDISRVRESIFLGLRIGSTLRYRYDTQP